MQRRPIDEVVHDLDTTSAKIRALARAGYTRAEIGRALSITYQHVRKVLLDSGITGGLQGERGTAPLASPPTRERKATSWEVLLRAGFEHVGEWTRRSENAVTLDAKAPTNPGIYAFVVDEFIAYIGLTNSSLRRRFDQYARGHAGQRTNARVNDLIQKALADGSRVKVLIAMPEPLEWNGLPVNTAAGLEAALIDSMKPRWNIQGAM